jgi:fructokinase
MILVCGEALIDLFMESDVPRGPRLKPVIGGSPLNLAIGLARLETPAAFFGGLSVDYFGTMLVDTMQKEGIDTSLLKRNARPTPLVLVSPDAEGHPSYTFYAHNSAVQHVDHIDALSPLPSSVAAIALGSYAIAVEPVGSALLSLAKREAQRTVVAIDFNLRPAMVGPLHLWRRRMEEFARCASIAKLSDEDFANGWSEGGQLEDQAAHWLELGVKLVIVTSGVRGATAWHRSGRVTVSGLPVTVVDTVGAGDSFQAALLTRLAHNGLLSTRALATLDRTSIVDAMRYANLAAGITCSRRGADLPRRSEIEKLWADGRSNV